MDNNFNETSYLIDKLNEITNITTSVLREVEFRRGRGAGILMANKRAIENLEQLKIKYYRKQSATTDLIDAADRGATQAIEEMKAILDKEG